MRSDLLDPLLVVFSGRAARRWDVVGRLEHARRPDLDVPQIDEVVDVLDEPHPVLLHLDAEVVVAQRVDREARADRAVVADCLTDELEDLAEEARAILERAPVLVRALVEVRHQELLRDADCLRAVDQDQIEPGRAAAFGGVDIEALELADVTLVHLPARGSSPTPLGEGSCDTPRVGWRISKPVWWGPL